MTNEQFELLERIFSDSHIIDIDFSEWDKKIAICLLADHYRDYSKEKRKPVLIIDFIKVHEFNVKFNHFHIKLDNPNKHIQWPTDTIEIKNKSGFYEITIYEMPRFPKLSLYCELIEIEEIPIIWLDNLFPGWGKPFSPLARPGISKMYNSRFR